MTSSHIGGVLIFLCRHSSISRARPEGTHKSSRLVEGVVGMVSSWSSHLLAMLVGLVWCPYNTVGGWQVEMARGSVQRSSRHNSGIGFLSSPQALQRNVQQDFACHKPPLSPGHGFTCPAAMKSASSKFFGFRTAPPLKPHVFRNREPHSTKWTCLNQLNDDDRDDNEWEVVHISV